MFGGPVSWDPPPSLIPWRFCGDGGREIDNRWEFSIPANSPVTASQEASWLVKTETYSQVWVRGDRREVKRLQTDRAGVRRVRELGVFLLFLDSCAGMLCGEAWDSMALKHAGHFQSFSASCHVGPVSTKTTPPRTWLPQRDIKWWKLFRQEKVRPEMSPEWWAGKGCVKCVWMSVLHLNSQGGVQVLFISVTCRGTQTVTVPGT